MLETMVSLPSPQPQFAHQKYQDLQFQIFFTHKMHYFQVLIFSQPTEGNSRFSKQDRKEQLTLLSCSSPLGIAQDLLLLLNVVIQIRAKSDSQPGYSLHSFFVGFVLIEFSKVNLDQSKKLFGGYFQNTQVEHFDNAKIRFWKTSSEELIKTPS